MYLIGCNKGKSHRSFGREFRSTLNLAELIHLFPSRPPSKKHLKMAAMAMVSLTKNGARMGSVVEIPQKMSPCVKKVTAVEMSVPMSNTRKNTLKKKNFASKRTC